MAGYIRKFQGHPADGFRSGERIGFTVRQTADDLFGILHEREIFLHAFERMHAVHEHGIVHAEIPGRGFQAAE